MRARHWILLGVAAVVIIVGGVVAGTLVHQADTSPTTRTYTAADLTKILQSVDAAQGKTGRIYNAAQFKQRLTSSGMNKVMGEMLQESDAKVTPSKCASLVRTLPMTNPQVAPASNTSESQLVLGDTSVVLATVPSEKVSSTLWSQLVAKSLAAEKACRVFGVSFSMGKTLYDIEYAIVKVKVSTKAQHSIAFEEAIGFPPAGIVFYDIENVQSIEGNLYMNVTNVASNPSKSPTAYRKPLIAYTNQVLKYAANP